MMQRAFVSVQCTGSRNGRKAIFLAARTQAWEEAPCIKSKGAWAAKCVRQCKFDRHAA